MGYAIFITAHGGRDAGTSHGTYLVPPGVKIYFYVKDGELMRGDTGSKVEDTLTKPKLNINMATKAAKYVYKPYDIIPNYIAYGSDISDPAFQFATGIYLVGSSKGQPPHIEIEDGGKEYLSDIVAYYRENHPGLVRVYWMCCRATPQNSNATVDVSTGTFAMQERARDMGMKPSDVMKFGEWR